jgi:hypothetical protein
MHKQKSTRFIQRLVPIEKTCYASMEEIECMAKDLLKPHFHPEDENEKRHIKVKYYVTNIMRIRNE